MKITFKIENLKWGDRSEQVDLNNGEITVEAAAEEIVESIHTLPAIIKEIRKAEKAELAAALEKKDVPAADTAKKDVPAADTAKKDVKKDAPAKAARYDEDESLKW